MVRTPYYCSKTGLKKGTWTPEEDRKLLAYVSRHGCWNWRQLPKYAGLARCGKSCRLRWMNYLRPNIKRGNYTKEEEDTIIRLHELLGNKWSAIAAQLPGRTDNEIKNHWHTYLKKRLNQNSVINNEAKENPRDPFYDETNQEGESRPNIIINSQEEESKPDTDDQHLNPITRLNLESFSLSSQPSSSDQLCSITTVTSVVAGSNMKLTLDDNDFLFQPYAEPSGNFWTEPFLADNFYISNNVLPPFYGPGNVSLHSPFVDEEILWP